jgi:hypothetical protein
MLAPAAVAYVYPFKLYIGPALVIALAVSLALLVRLPTLKGKVGAALIILGVIEAYSTFSLAFLEGFIIAICTLIAGITLESSALQPNRAILLRKRRRFSFKTAAAVILVCFGAVAAFAGVLLGSLVLVWGGLTGLVFGCVVGVELLASFVKRQLRLKNPAFLGKVAYVVLAAVILASGLLISLRATDVVHEQRLETWRESAVNLTVQGVVLDSKENYEVNTGYSYHVFPAYFALNVTRVLWVGVGESLDNLTSAVAFWSNRTVVVACDKSVPQGLAIGQTVEVNGWHCIWLEDSIYSGTLIVAPSISESYLRLI